MSDDRVLRADAGGLCTLTLNRPDKLNALDTASFEALDAHLAALEGESDRIGCVMLRGAGRGFCAGADLGGIGTAAVAPGYKAGVIDRLSRLPQPVIAAVHGVCLTGGLELALACDLILADPTARFADTHGKWGLVGQWGMIVRLPRRIGTPAAKRMMMTGRMVGAEEALAIGLVDLLADESGLDALVEETAQAILANSGFTNSAVKRMLAESGAMSLGDALAYERDHHPGFAPDYQDRIARFSKR